MMNNEPTGWICPRCKRSNAPSRQECVCSTTEGKATIVWPDPPRYVPDWTYRPWPYTWPYYPVTICTSSTSIPAIEGLQVWQ